MAEKTEQSVQDQILEERTREFVGILSKLLEPIKNDLAILVEHGRTSNERLHSIEKRLTFVERHVGMNGRGGDTEPPETQPDNERPEDA